MIKTDPTSTTDPTRKITIERLPAQKRIIHVNGKRYLVTYQTKASGHWVDQNIDDSITTPELQKTIRNLYSNLKEENKRKFEQIQPKEGSIEIGFSASHTFEELTFVNKNSSKKLTKKSLSAKKADKIFAKHTSPKAKKAVSDLDKLAKRLAGSTDALTTPSPDELDLPESETDEEEPISTRTPIDNTSSKIEENEEPEDGVPERSSEKHDDEDLIQNPTLPSSTLSTPLSPLTVPSPLPTPTSLDSRSPLTFTEATLHPSTPTSTDPLLTLPLTQSLPTSTPTSLDSRSTLPPPSPTSPSPLIFTETQPLPTSTTNSTDSGSTFPLTQSLTPLPTSSSTTSSKKTSIPAPPPPARPSYYQYTETTFPPIPPLDSLGNNNSTSLISQTPTSHQLLTLPNTQSHSPSPILPKKTKVKKKKYRQPPISLTITEPSSEKTERYMPQPVNRNANPPLPGQKELGSFFSTLEKNKTLDCALLIFKGNSEKEQTRNQEIAYKALCLAVLVGLKKGSLGNYREGIKGEIDDDRITAAVDFFEKHGNEFEIMGLFTDPIKRKNIEECASVFSQILKGRTSTSYDIV